MLVDTFKTFSRTDIRLEVADTLSVNQQSARSSTKDQSFQPTVEKMVDLRTPRWEGKFLSEAAAYRKILSKKTSNKYSGK